MRDRFLHRSRKPVSGSCSARQWQQVLQVADVASQPKGQSTRSKLLPPELHVMALFPRQPASSAGVQVTETHVSALPATVPSTSQNGNRGSVQEPSTHDSGFGVVPQLTTSTNPSNHRRLRMWRVLLGFTKIVEGPASSLRRSFTTHQVCFFIQQLVDLRGVRLRRNWCIPHPASRGETAACSGASTSRRWDIRVGRASPVMQQA